MEILGCTTVDILITDIEMPGMSGLELIRQVRKDFPKVRIIVLSGYSNFEYARTTLRYGVKDYLLKPLQQDALSELLCSIRTQIMEERKLSSREILSLALRESTVLDTPDAFAGGGLLLFYITLGNLLPDAAVSLACGRLSSSPATGSTLCGRIARYIESNLTQSISLAELSDRFGYTPSYINRIFKKEYATSPLQYLTDLRMSRAKELLLNTPDINIKSVAQSVGYEDARYFSRVFKNETGLTPSGWVEEHRK